MGMQHNKANIHLPNTEDPGYVHFARVAYQIEFKRCHFNSVLSRGTHNSRMQLLSLCLLLTFCIPNYWSCVGFLLPGPPTPRRISFVV